MNYVTIETKGTKAAHLLASTIKSLVVAAIEAKQNDGKISADEIAAIGMAHFTKVMEVVGEVGGLIDEVKEAPVAFSRSLIVPLSEIGDLFVDNK